MKIKVKKVYYCDFCKKHSLKSIKFHEKHCTGNPNRECRMCGRKDINTIIPKYKIEIKNEWFKAPNTIEGTIMEGIEGMVAKTMEELENDTEGCPACMLTVIRCNEYKWPINPKFDYKKATEEWWDGKNKADMEAETQSLMYG